MKKAISRYSQEDFGRWFSKNKGWLVNWFSCRREIKEIRLGGYFQTFVTRKRIPDYFNNYDIIRAKSELYEEHIGDILRYGVFSVKNTTVPGGIYNCLWGYKEYSMEGFLDKMNRFPTKKDKVTLEWYKLYFKYFPDCRGIGGYINNLMELKTICRFKF